MAEISFEQLYGTDKQAALGLFLLWSNDFLTGFALDGSSTISTEDAFSFVSNLRADGYFPAAGGYEKASPFKKAANLYVWLHALKPFKDVPSKDIFGEDLSKFPHIINSLIGYSIVKACLHGAEIHKCDDTVVKLDKPLQLSRHFFCDLVEASAAITPESHFKPFSLLFEALAYEANPQACYPKVF